MVVNIPLLAITLPDTLANPAVLRLAAVKLPVKLIDVVAIVPVIVPLILPPVMLPEVLICPVPANTLPPVMLAVVVMLAADTNVLITLPLRLNPAAFKLPAVTLPVTLTTVPV